MNDEGWYIDNVRLLSPDAPPAALALQGATAGQVAFRERRQFQFRFTPDALPPGTDGLETFLHVQHNEPRRPARSMRLRPAMAMRSTP